MIRLVWESFLRAIIRFWDNRFLREDRDDFYEREISRLHQIINDLTVPKIMTAEVVDDIEQPLIRKPIETLLQKRTRLERESREKWNEELKTASANRASIKTTEELEREVGVS